MTQIKIVSNNETLYIASIPWRVISGFRSPNFTENRNLAGCFNDKELKDCLDWLPIKKEYLILETI